MKKRKVLKEEDAKIDVLIGTKEESIWQEVKEKTEKQIELLEKELVINKEVFKLCLKKTKNLKPFNIS